MIESLGNQSMPSNNLTRYAEKVVWVIWSLCILMVWMLNLWTFAVAEPGASFMGVAVLGGLLMLAGMGAVMIGSIILLCMKQWRRAVILLAALPLGVLSVKAAVYFSAWLYGWELGHH